MNHYWWGHCRVEGRGACTIHDVAISRALASPNSKSTPKLESLRKEKGRVQKALDRKIKAIQAISSFYNSLTADQVNAIDLVKTTGQLESVHAELDEKLLNLEDELRVLEEQIKHERETLDGDLKGERLRRSASIMIATEKDVDVEIVISYGTDVLLSRSQ